MYSIWREEDYGLDYGLDYGPSWTVNSVLYMDYGLSWTVNNVLEVLFKEDFECWIAQ